MKALGISRWGSAVGGWPYLSPMTDSATRTDLGADPRLEHLIVATSALITELSLDGVLQRVVQVAAEVIGAHYAAIGVLAPDGRRARELHDPRHQRRGSGR